MKLFRTTAVLGLSTPLVVMACDTADTVDPNEQGGSDGGSDTSTDLPATSSSEAAMGSVETDAMPPESGTASASTHTSAGPPGEVGSDPEQPPGAPEAAASATASAQADAEPPSAGNADGGSTSALPEASAPVVRGAQCAAGERVCFGMPFSLTVPSEVPADVAIGEWEGNPGQELVVANTGDLVYFKNDGTGQFSDAIPNLALRGSQTYPPGAISVALGQFDNDAALDVLVGQASKTKPMIAFGVGNGGIDAAEEPPFGEGTSPDFHVADIEGSGPSEDFLVVTGTDLMVVVTSGQHGEEYLAASFEFHGNRAVDGAIAKLGDDQWVVYSGETSVFQARIDYDPEAQSLLVAEAVGTPVGGAPTQMDIGDFDEDGFDDVVVCLLDSRDINVLRADGQGAGSFAPLDGGNAYVSLRVGDTADDATQADVKTGDFNGDGHVDIAVSVQAKDVIRVFAGDGTGAFDAPVSVATGAGSNPTRLSVGDLNADGIDDLVAVGSGSEDVIVILSEP